MTELALVYLVGGLSSRFEGKPKYFAKVGPNDETLVEYSLNQALPAGFTKIILITSKKTYPLVREKFQDSYKGLPIIYAMQKFDETKRTRPWGTADALDSAKEYLDCPFIICNGDDIYGKESFKILTEHLKTKDTNITLGYKLGKVLAEQGTVNRGIFQVENNQVTNIKETLEISKQNLEGLNLTEETLCSMNLFGLQPETIILLSEKVNNFKEINSEDQTAECYLPTELNNLIKEKKIVLEISPTNEQWFGLTHPEDELIVKNKLKELN